MTATREPRETVRRAADETWGPEVAAAMMELLPPTGWGQLATNDDLRATEERLDARMGRASAEMRDELHQEISGVHKEIGGLRDELHQEISGLRDDFRRELHTEVSRLDSRLHAMTRTYIMGNVGLVFTVAAIAFGAAQIA